jgi:hypothetical protein
MNGERVADVSLEVEHKAFVCIERGSGRLFCFAGVCKERDVPRATCCGE